MKTLDEIGLSHGTDKASSFHGYLNAYESLFAPMRDLPIRLLEIGVLGGASLRTWRDYFTAGDIIGLDCDDKTGLELGERVTILRGDASKASGWTTVQMHLEQHYGEPDALDVLIDDGAHTVFSVVAAFRFGFRLLRPGGLYICEDVHSGYLPFYRRDNHNIGLPDTFGTADFFASLINQGVNENGRNECGKIALEETRIESMTFRKSLVIIKKR